MRPILWLHQLRSLYLRCHSAADHSLPKFGAEKDRQAVNRKYSWDWNDLDHSSAAKLLARHFPDSNLEPFGSGDFCLAFKRGGPGD
jgi:hypothetical protein